MIAKNRIPDPFVSLTRLKEMGFNPKSIFDIGAYEGDFTNMCLSIWQNADITAFEALPDKIIKIKKKFSGKRVKIVEGIVGEAVQESVPYFADETASSVLKSDEVDTIKKVLVQKMITLDSYLKETNSTAPHFLKIDTQGYEYQILKGFEENLHKVEVILLELNFIEVYHHVKLADEVINYLSRFDFVIYDICEIHRRPLDNALFQIDFLFIKKDSFLRREKKWNHKKIN